MKVEIPPNAGVDELRKMLEALLNYLVDAGLTEGSFVCKLSEATA